MSKDAWLNWYPEREVEEGVVRFSRLLKESGSSRVLDFGCGTGRNTVYLARLGFETHGFDWSEAAVAAAKQELSRAGLGADLRVWDMNETPYPYSDAKRCASVIIRVIRIDSDFLMCSAIVDLSIPKELARASGVVFLGME